MLPAEQELIEQKFRARRAVGWQGRRKHRNVKCRTNIKAYIVWKGQLFPDDVAKACFFVKVLEIC